MLPVPDDDCVHLTVVTLGSARLYVDGEYRGWFTSDKNPLIVMINTTWHTLAVESTCGSGNNDIGRKMTKKKTKKKKSHIVLVKI